MSALSAAHLQTTWAELNARYFRGTLPPIEIRWSARLTSSAGMFVSRVGPRARSGDGADTRPERRCIRLSIPLLRRPPKKRHGPEQEPLSTLAHEMIHQWQFDVLKRRPDHGPEFRRMMEAMNRDGLGVTIYHSLAKEVDALSRYAWRCQDCGRVYRRQRRTIHPRRHRCGACRGALRELPVAQRIRPVSRRRETGGSIQLTLPFSIA
ncbi:MAG: SprT-like domain-containing protein [Nitrospirota bacterium]